MVQVRAATAGYHLARIAGASLRKDFVTADARAGANVVRLKEVSWHRSADVLASYVRDARLFEDRVGEKSL